MYRVIELQTTGTATAMIDHGDYPDREHADSKAHDVAKYAAVSTIEIHTVTVINPEGVTIIKYPYKHDQNNQNGGEE